MILFKKFIIVSQAFFSVNLVSKLHTVTRKLKVVVKEKFVALCFVCLRLQKPERSLFKQMIDGANLVIIETKDKCSINISTARLIRSLWMVIEMEA